jgi:hypothetical protein
MVSPGLPWRPVRAPTVLCLPLLVAAGALAAASGGAAGSTPFCTGGELAGTFAVVPGSAGAGNIVYALTLRNRTAHTCAVAGLPDVTLLGRSGKALPTHVRAAFPNRLTSVLVRIAPGRTTRATARFSPDVPGPGEPVSGRQCEPKAYRLAVHAPAGGTAVVPIMPPTPVCEHGQLQLGAYAPVR